jgi:hypothetical protein
MVGEGKDAMKLRNPRLIRVAGWVIAVVIRLWMATVRFRLTPETAARHPADPRRETLLYAFWHESILALTAFRVPAHVLISQHADGELIARACKHLGFGTVRGSTTRGGGVGLLGMRDQAARTHLAITPDGPRGPRRRVQVGIVALASHTGLPIVPLGVGFTWAWRAKSWDRFALPWPFSRITGVAGEPIVVPPDLDRDGLEEYRLRVEQEFLRVTATAERWAEELARGHRPEQGPHLTRAGFPIEAKFDA